MTLTSLLSRSTRTVAATVFAAVACLGTVVVTPVSAQVTSPIGDAALSAASGAEEASLYVDNLGRPTPLAQEKVAEFAAQPWLPQDISAKLLAAVAFLAGHEQTGGPELVQPDNAPAFTQFLLPSVAGSCIGGIQDSVGTAIAVPGPSEIPAPGVLDGQTAFLFTALGTTAAAPEQGAMSVTWINLDTLAFGETPLYNNGINPQGPATISGVADTGKGAILAVLRGTVNTTQTPCTYSPTAAIINAR